MATFRLHYVAITAFIVMMMMSTSSSTSYYTTAHPNFKVMDHRLAFVSTHLSCNERKRNMTAKQQVSLSMSAEEKDYVSPMRQRPRPKGGDVAYNNENILRQQRYYNDIKKVGGKACVQDVYARDPSSQNKNNIRYWFVGKVARCTGTVAPELAIAKQFNLIEEHATRIRPVELGRYFGKLEFYAAPGDTELLTSQNDPGIRLKKVSRYVDGSEKVPLLEVGLDLSIVTNRGAGLYIVRTDEGVVPPHLIGDQ